MATPVQGRPEELRVVHGGDRRFNSQEPGMGSRKRPTGLHAWLGCMAMRGPLWHAQLRTAELETSQPYTAAVRLINPPPVGGIIRATANSTE